jgi:hypothetical protein
MVVMGRKYGKYGIYFYHHAIVYNILELMGPLVHHSSNKSLGMSLDGDMTTILCFVNA